jgi:hypothetical protein
MLFSSSLAIAGDYFCILAEVENSLPIRYDRKTEDLARGPINLILSSGYSSTIEQVVIPATEYQSESSWLAVSIMSSNGVSTDSLYPLDQTHTFLKLNTREAGVSVQCSKR